MPIVIGIDEVGLGCIAGPVVVAAVVLDELPGVTDSKKLTSNRRLALDIEIREKAPYWIIVRSDIEFINRYGIGPCHKSCIRTVAHLARHLYPHEEVILDGNLYIKGIGPHTPMVKADLKVPAVGAASIIAKVYRDNLMTDMAANYPRYGWERNKGYPTQEHVEALEKYGVTAQHRKKYAPVRRILIGRQ